MTDPLFQEIEQLKFDDFLYFVFIFAALLDVYADAEMKRKYRMRGGKDPAKLYLLASVLVLLVFFFFGLRNYRQWKSLDRRSASYAHARMRVLGSMFLVYGQLLLIGYLLKQKTITEGPI